MLGAKDVFLLKEIRQLVWYIVLSKLWPNFNTSRTAIQSFVQDKHGQVSHKNLSIKTHKRINIKSKKEKLTLIKFWSKNFFCYSAQEKILNGLSQGLRNFPKVLTYKQSSEVLVQRVLIRSIKIYKWKYYTIFLYISFTIHNFNRKFLNYHVLNCLNVVLNFQFDRSFCLHSGRCVKT